MALSFAVVAGLAMMAAGALATLAMLLWLLPLALRVRRRARVLQAAVAAGRRDVEAALARLAADEREREALLVPWLRLYRWSRHPLVVASIEWYGRRRRARGRAGA